MSTADTRSIEWQRKQEWEESATNTYRLRVPGGWLYIVGKHSTSAVFVPDQQV